jgi:hypothetical protein
VNGVSGRVGIQTATPSYPLDVNGVVNAQAFYINGTPLSSTWLLSGQNTFFNSGKVGIGTSSPLELFHLAGGNLVSDGQFGTAPTVSISGAGTRMIWNPRKAAFRAGYVDSTQWDDSNLGTYSVVFGRNNKATGVASAALSGLGNTVSGSYSVVAGGSNNAVYGTGSTVLGGQNNTVGLMFTLGRMRPGALFGDPPQPIPF